MSQVETNGRGEFTPPVGLPEEYQEIDEENLQPIPKIDLAPVDPVVEWNPHAARFSLLLWIVWIFAGTLVFAFFGALISTDDSWPRIESVLKAVIPVETLILGAAASYYFKSNP